MALTGRLSSMLPCTYTPPLYCTGLQTIGAEHDGCIGVISSHWKTYSILPLLISDSASVTGIFKESKVFSGMYFRSTARNPSKDNKPVQVQASFRDLKNLVDCMIFRISS